MKTPEEEADKEIGKRLREKFEGYKAPVKDQVRVNIFAALEEPTSRLYWVLGVCALLFIVAFFLSDRLWDGGIYNQASISAQHQTRAAIKSKMQEKSVLQSKDRKSEEMDGTYVKSDTGPSGVRKMSGEKVSNQIQNGKNADNLIIQKYRREKFEKSSIQYGADEVSRQPIGDSATMSTRKADVETNSAISNTFPAQHYDLEFLIPIDSVKTGRHSWPLTIPQVAENTVSQSVEKMGIRYGVKAVFSASALQTFQLVNLSHSGADRIQNFEFAPYLSSRSLSYKFTAGLEKKHTQMLVSYQYLRNWNEYEIGTNQVIATQAGTQKYEMTRVGEKHVADDRSHLIAIGIKESFMLPKHLLKNYGVNLGMEYTHIVSASQGLLWGNLGFYKQFHQSRKSQFEIGPYLQYSFFERKVAGQIWRYRPYQIGISLGMKVK